ncbi:MAG: glutathione synthetase [Alcanivorax borkumensis]|jgi:glutathione synthase|uniref:Glutathione synthetase n=1 Tax=Alcanivorax borkumensis (strain ATCC 700651 / DSM 11573 / NCIMB 13689 / SK2) TaxID=393595 RepID=Q0VTI5_ALCBS|nr:MULTISPECIES: glutathione synthase [Alcanivorax]OJH08875.1 MAG: glutathione synthetase [Alcanivorax borkumensis]EUC69034.1 glutathione synthetase [Alcanivorax sp. 97CO-5]PKG01147.1 glutathione synthase [Alcanivorax sp. 97CO-6]CAL15558.1 glutathione synthetase [Alcanivorax borkumensis SK2]BAP12963.1 glutathione synthetase [Alcanivorax sp. NBRC 101098]
MSLRVGVVMDPIAKIKPWKDTTFAMLLEAQRRGWSLLYMEPGDLYIRDGRTFAITRTLSVTDNNDDWYRLADTVNHDLADLDIILMRQDPPFNAEYIYATYLLEKAEQEGVMVVNRPGSVRDSNEKLFATDFPQCCAPTLVSSQSTLLRDFVQEFGDTVMKPLDGMGGSNIFRVRKDSPNISVVIEVLTQHGKTPIMAQRFVPEITEGDKRILMINGEPVPYALARIPKEGELRGNLAAGGTGQGRELSDRDRWICEQVGPTLKRKGLYFVGLDVIGDYLTEINVTSPTCVRELDAIFDINIAGQLFDALLELRSTS